ncbi:MAG: phage major capsid protein, partial [Caulobacteraceae bacterium]|nr:phage major capsid protein [Caulobacteraceae bacterium]
VSALEPKVAEMKAQVASEVAALDAKHAATVAQLNEDAAKKGEALTELKDKVNSLVASNGKLKSAIEAEAGADRQRVIKGAIMDIVTENFEKIKEMVPFNQMKVVGTMTLSNNLTGTSQISYVESPILRSFYNPHLYDVFRIIPTATGNVTFPRGNTSIGEGSFGTQTEGSAKAQVDYDVTMVNTSLSFIAGYARVSRQMLQDLPFLQAYLSSSLLEDWNRKVNDTFMATITASATGGSTSATPVVERIVDYIAQHLALGLGQPNLILTTHAVWASVLKTVPSNGSYSVPGGVTIGANGETRILGIPLVPHSQIPSGKIYVMNTNAFAIGQASGLAVRSTEFNEDDFIKNLVTYRCEARIGLLSFQPTAAIYGSAS